MARLLVLASLLLACGRRNDLERAADIRLPPSDETLRSLPAEAPLEDLLAAVDEGLATREKGPDLVRFVVLRAADRHGARVEDGFADVTVGAGVRLPAGSLRIRREWLASGKIDGVNEEPQVMGLSVAVENGAPQPFPPAVAGAVARFCEALAMRLPLHPDCIVAMGEVPYARPHAADAAERALAAAARGRVPVPDVDGRLVLGGGDRRIEIGYELRNTDAGIRTGMMLRRRFDGPRRGMLFVYAHRWPRKFYMRNCFIEIDLAYILHGRIEQIVTMKPAAGMPPSEIPLYESSAAVRYALEMPGGWFAREGIAVGDAVGGLPEG